MGKLYGVSCMIINIIVMLVVSACLACDIDPTKGFRGMFIFGDDVVDNGNNNNIVTPFVRANYMPYGVDFPNGPSGRFSNGKLIVDAIADNLGLPYPPSYPDCFHQGSNIIQGVNFGSSGTGVLSVTGSGLVGIQHMDEQIARFSFKILPELKQILNCKGQAILPQYLFVIGTGNNDFASYYLLKQYLAIDPHIFAGTLTTRYSSYIKSLYDMGARKFLLISPYPMGCSPGIVGERKEACITFLNNATDIFYQSMINLVDHAHQQSMNDAEFTVLNAGLIIHTIYNNMTDTGITVMDCACCAIGLGDMCKNAGKACLNRNNYLYYDNSHLTEIANSYLARLAFASNDKSQVYPVNLMRLAPPKLIA